MRGSALNTFATSIRPASSASTVVSPGRFEPYAHAVDRFETFRPVRPLLEFGRSAEYEIVDVGEIADRAQPVLLGESTRHVV